MCSIEKGPLSHGGAQRGAVGLIAAALAAAILSGCAVKAAPFSFQVGGGAIPLRMTREASSPRAQNSSLTPAVVTDRFTPTKPVRVENAGMGFFIRYPADLAGTELRLSLAEGPKGKASADGISASLPSGAGAAVVDYELPVPKGASLESFELSGKGKAKIASIESTGIAPLAHGVSISPGLLKLSDGFVYSEETSSTGAPDRVQSFSFPKLTKEIAAAGPNEQVQIVVSYRFPPAGAEGGSGKGEPPAGGAGADPGAVDLTLSAAGASEVFRLTQSPGSHKAYLYTASLGFSPEKLKVSSGDPSFAVTNVSVNPFDAQGLSPDAPIPADVGTALVYSPKYWRNSRYELFKWNLFPDVLIIVFNTYLDQGHALARLAYFLEKAGYTGRLLTTAELGNLVGWYAHDYGAQELARFFQTAQDEHVSLRPAETNLRSILEKNGIIHSSGGNWVAGKGAIISVAESSGLLLRTLLLTHESFHGIFFTHPEYRAAVRAIWEHTNPAEQLFWRLFLGSSSYDVADQYLVVNEFQAYLMQQPLSLVDGRYADWQIHRIEALYPKEAPALEAMLKAHPHVFLDTARQIDAAVYKIAGVHAGDTATLVPVSAP